MQNHSRECFAMSAAPSRPEREPSDDTHPALQSHVTAVPVTPGLYTAGHSAYFQPDAPIVHPPLPFDAEKAPSGPQWNPNSSSAVSDDRASSPTDVAAGAKSPDEILRRLSRPNLDPAAKSDLADIDPKAAHPNLNLSGGVISATTAVPYSIGYSPGNDWVSRIPPLREQSLYHLHRNSAPGAALPLSSTRSPTSPLPILPGTIP